MGKLSDVQYALNGEPSAQKKGTLTTDQQIEQAMNFDLVSQRDSELQREKVVVFKLVNSNRKGGVYLPHICDTIHPETKKIERMRLLNGISSPWLKDQKDVTPEYAKLNARSIKFPRGIRLIQIPEMDEAAVTFLRNHSSNTATKYQASTTAFDFFEYDPAAMEKARLEKETLAIDMAIAASQQPADKMIKHAAYLGLRFFDDYGIKITETGIRSQYQRYAHNYPEQFKKSLDSRPVEVNWMVRKAITETLLDINREPGKVYWANNGGFICSIPNGENPQKFLTDLALTPTQEGQRFLEDLQRTIKD